MNAPFITCAAYHLPAYRRPWEGPYRTREDLPEVGEGLPVFRRTFTCEKTISAAQIEVTALGVFELYCNGQRVGVPGKTGTVYDELKPGFTDFRERVHTYHYDLKPYLARTNVLVAVVAPGWWSGRISFGAFGLQPLCLAAEMTLAFTDGTVQNVVTDTDWETAVCGPVLSADIYDGEYIDARLPQPYEEMNPYEWVKATLYDGFSGKAEPRVGPPVRLRPDLTRHPVSAVVWREIVPDGTDYGAVKPRMKRVGNDCEKMTLYPGEHLVLDMGQNITGRPSLRLSAPCDAEIHILTAEMLNDSGSRARGNDGPAGSLYVTNYRSARSTVAYRANGSGEEEVTPLYTFYGFRYLEITVTETTEIVQVEGQVLTSDIPEGSSLVTDNEEVNRLISNIEWGRRSNYLFVPTDCPQRDERLGWTGDTQIFAGAAAYLCDVRSFFRKWLCDARDSQKVLGGAYADVIPHVLGNNFAGNTGWGDAAVILPDVLWRMYGDTAVMREHYASMEEYMEWLTQFGLAGARTAYGDWLSYENTDKTYIAVCYYAADASLMEKYSRILSERAGDFYAGRAEHYRALADRIRTHFAQKYIRGGEITERSQTAYLLALKYKMTDDTVARRTAAALCQSIRDNGYTLSTGFIGTGILAQTLSDIGEDGLAYSLLLQTRDPSWLYSVRQGATTVWERWNSYTLENGFGKVSMNSFNHYAYGAVLEWLYTGVAGIRPDEDKPGFAHLILAPHPDIRADGELPAGQTPLRAVHAHYDSIAGRVESEWHYENGEFVWHFTVPDGITATVCFPLLCNRRPAPERTGVTLNGIAYTPGELCGTVQDGILRFELPGGTYEMR